jgi:GNAT superfamily N-acetyltransferase
MLDINAVPFTIMLGTPGRPSVRAAQAADVPALIPQRQVWQHLAGHSPQPPLIMRLQLEYWLTTRATQLLVADSGDLAGYCLYNLTEPRLAELFVAPAWRGQSVGQELVGYAEHALARYGRRPVRVAPTPETYNFFARLGYSPLPASPETGMATDWFKVL